jgi:hypothetical protein
MWGKVQDTLLVAAAAERSEMVRSFPDSSIVFSPGTLHYAMGMEKLGVHTIIGDNLMDSCRDSELP